MKKSFTMTTTIVVQYDTDEQLQKWIDEDQHRAFNNAPVGDIEEDIFVIDEDEIVDINLTK